MTPKDVLTNPAFCPMPWTGLMYNFDGDIKNCIRSANTIGNIKDNTIEDILHSNSNVARQAMIIDRSMPSNCRPCHDLEVGKNSFDIISDRKFYIRELKHVPLDTYHPNKFDLHTIDVRWTNLCNFACTYCGPRFSSRWADEVGSKQDVPTNEQRSAFKEYIFQHAPQLKHVYLAGGEPLLMKENLELLDLLDPEVNLRINTNLSKVDTRVFDRICEFRNVHWIVSVESIEEEYNYIRYGGNWTDFLDNLIAIKKLDHKISFNMLHFLLNYKSIFGCVDYLKQLGFHNNSFIIGPLLTPEYLNIRHLPNHVLEEVKTILKNRINDKPGYLLEDSYCNMLAYIKQPITKNLNDSFTRIAELNQRRGLDSSKIFKDVYEYC
jgi:radical SAM protein with 4Fe4S-binding SPASM domain